nr:LysR family transcriptional regulator [Robertmurraya massiliosenegalensis]
MMENRDWIILRDLYEKRNITKTAESLFISQPALTNRLHHIENEFQVKIVNRGRRGVQFTPEGEYLAKYAIEMLHKYQQTKEAVQHMKNQVAGTLRLGVSNFFTKYQLPSLLEKFRTRYPEIEYEIETGWSKDMYQALYNQAVHIAFIRGDYGFIGEKELLFEEEIFVVSKEKMDLSKLPEMPRIDYETDVLLKEQVDQWWRVNYKEPPNRFMTVNQVDTCKEMVVSGLGYGILPSMMIEEAKGLHKEVLTAEDGSPMVRKTWMYYHPQSLKTTAVKAFVEFVKEEYR